VEGLEGYGLEVRGLEVRGLGVKLKLKNSKTYKLKIKLKNLRTYKLKLSNRDYEENKFCRLGYDCNNRLLVIMCR
jgi:hypothetical protein